MKNFNELRAKMSPEAQARSTTMAQEMLAEMQKADEFIQKLSKIVSDTKSKKRNS